MKKVLFALCSIIMLCTFSSCQKESKFVLGKWNVDSIDIYSVNKETGETETETILPDASHEETFRATVNDNGTGVFEVTYDGDLESYPFTYVLAGDIMTVDMDMSDETWHIAFKITKTGKNSGYVTGDLVIAGTPEFPVKLTMTRM